MSESQTPRGHAFIVSAPSGGGKTSLTRALIPLLAQQGRAAEISVSYTTRAPRPGEQNGEHYHFVDAATFAAMRENGEFLESAEVFGRRYGTGRARTEALLAAGTDVILDIDWQGAHQVKRQIADVSSIFILPPSREELERRLRSRGQDGDDVIARRMAEAQAEMIHYAEYDYLIINEDFGSALNELAAIVMERRLRQPEQAWRHAGLIRSLLESPASIR